MKEGKEAQKHNKNGFLSNEIPGDDTQRRAEGGLGDLEAEEVSKDRGATGGRAQQQKTS